MKTTDNIEIILPFKAEYVSIARLAASGIANRVGFDIETIEDIKVAIAEVCNKMVNLGSSKSDSYKLIFKITEDKLVVVFDCEDKSLRCIFKDQSEELGVAIINALMDNVEFCSSNDYILLMTKELEGKR